MSNNFYIQNKSTGKYFSWFKNNIQVWGDIKSSKPFDSQLLAETQVLLFNNEETK